MPNQTANTRRPRSPNRHAPFRNTQASHLELVTDLWLAELDGRTTAPGSRRSFLGRQKTLPGGSNSHQRTESPPLRPA